MRKKLIFGIFLTSLALVSCDKNSNEKKTKSESVESKESITESSSKQESNTIISSDITIPETIESSIESSIESTIDSSSESSETLVRPDLDKDNIYLSNLSMGGVLNDMDDFTKYQNTSYYKQVSTARDFLNAIKSSRYEYETTIEDGKVKQTLTKESETHVIELTNDLDLGFNVLDKLGLVENYPLENWYTERDDQFEDPIIKESGISQIKIENISNLLIYSKNGSKIKHAGFKMNSCLNVAIRNIEFDEMWMWEDSPSASPSFKIGDYDAQPWAYFKIGYSENIWIDHCTFGKSFDGQIDISNANTKEIPSRIPYGSDCNGGGVHISYCNFNTGYDKDGNVKQYIKDECDNMEIEYQKYLVDKTTYTFDSPYSCRYYFTARDLGASYENMLYGVFVPQKKGFLLGDTGNSLTDEKELTNDTTFVSTKKYYKINGFEADGRMKFKNEGYTVGASVADTYYTYKDMNGETVTSNIWYEGLNIIGKDYYYNLNLKISFSSCKFIDIEDRLPNMRGGICYIYNSLIDSSSYYQYREKLLGLKDKMTTANNKYKMALVSQGLIACLTGSVYYDNVKMIGIEQALKNNNVIFDGKYDKDGNPLYEYDYSGYMLHDCYFLKNPDDTTAKICGSTSYDKTTDTVVDPFGVKFNYSSATLSPKYFNYHNETNELDFEIIGFSEYYLPISKWKDNQKYIDTPSLCLTSFEKVYFKELDAGITSELFDNFFLFNDYR